MDVSNPAEMVEIAKSRTAEAEIKAVSVSQEAMEMKTSDGQFPTEDELRTLRRVAGKVPWPAFTIAFVELCERFSYYGTTAVCMLSKDTQMDGADINSRQLHPTTSA